MQRLQNETPKRENCARALSNQQELEQKIQQINTSLGAVTLDPSLKQSVSLGYKMDDMFWALKKQLNRGTYTKEASNNNQVRYFK